jgi:predicted ATPase
MAWGGSTKLDWNDQIQLASTHIVADLKSRQLIFNQGQVIRFDDVSLACAYRTLAIIYSALGDPFKNKKDEALQQYSALMNIKRFTLDANLNGKVDRQEIGMNTGRLIR